METRCWLPSGWVITSVDFPGTWLGNRAVTSRLVPFSISVSPGLTVTRYSVAESVTSSSLERSSAAAVGGGGTCAQISIEAIKQMIVSAWVR